MGRVKQFFSDLFAIFFMSVGISTTRTKQKKFDLRRLVSNEDRGSEESRGAGEGWILVNRAASSVEYRNQQAVSFDSRPGAGLTWVEGLRFSVGKIDLNIAAVPQDVGIAFHVQNEREFEAVCFHVGNEAPDEGAGHGSVGLWIGPGSSALVADFRTHEVRSDIEKHIRSITGRRPMG